MEPQKFDIIVVGGGPAGVTAALRARELNASVALVEREQLGGTCTNDGCVPTRVFAKAARLLRDADQFADYGLLADKPSVDFQRLMSRAQHMVYRIHAKKQLLSHLTQSDVRVYEKAGDAHFIDEHTIALADGAQLEGTKFIICVGGHAHRLNIPGSEFATSFGGLWHLKELPRSMIVIGGAATGCQLASAFAVLGTEVTILERARILRAEDEAISQGITRAFIRHGIRISSGLTRISRIEKNEDGLTVHYIDDELEKTLSAETVIFSTGLEGNVSTLNLAAANVKTDQGRIVVNDYQQSSTLHIFAAGDITGCMMLVQSAGYEGRLAAENAVLGEGMPYKHLIVPHGGFTDPEYGSVGMTESEARMQHDCAVAVVRYANLDRAVIDGHTDGLCKLIVSKETHRILGAHIVGEQAVESIQFIAACMTADMWVEQLAEMELAYPTYTAVLGLAARQLVQDLGVMPLAPEWHALSPIYAAEWERADTESEAF